jgi:mitogen-activated protein kinase kinase kinase
MLTSKPPYANALGLSASQTPTASYHTGSLRTSTFSETQPGTLYTSPTKSEFSEVDDGLDAVR